VSNLTGVTAIAGGTYASAYPVGVSRHQVGKGGSGGRAHASGVVAFAKSSSPLAGKSQPGLRGSILPTNPLTVGHRSGHTDPVASETFAPIQTARLRLRPFRDSDAAAFAAYRSDPEVARYQGWDAPYPLARAEAFVREMVTAPTDVPGEWLQIAVSLTGDDTLIGDCAFVSQLDDPRIAEIGFTIAPAHQSRGYAQEAVRGLLGVLFGAYAKHRVFASCDARNVASSRLLAAVGMRQEGHLVESTWSEDEWTDDLLFAVLRREWTNDNG